MAALEELQEEVVRGLHILKKEHLLDICDSMKISGEDRADVKGKTRMSLMTHIMKHLEREGVAELEDDGMSELLALQLGVRGLHIALRWPA